MQLTIKITGSGTEEDLADALTELAEDINTQSIEEYLNGHSSWSWEDPTLYCEIHEDEEEQNQTS